MRFTREEAERLQEITLEMAELLDEFQGTCEQRMTEDEYGQFMRRTLCHIEPMVCETHNWPPNNYETEGLHEVAETAMGHIFDEEEDLLDEAE